MKFFIQQNQNALGFLVKSILVICIIVVISCSQKPAKIVDRSKIKYGKSNQLNKEKYRNIRQNIYDKTEIEESQSAEEVVVVQGDSIYSIARKNEVSIRELIDANNLKAPYALKIGEVIKIPSSKFHEVRENDTLYSISRSYGMKVDDLIALNSMKFPYTVRLGDKLKISEISKNSSQNNMAKKTIQANTKLDSVDHQNVAEKNSNKTATKSENKQSQSEDLANKIVDKNNNFSWPLRGKIVSKFGPKSGGLYNDGINIKANLGTKISSSEDGVVAYVGNELKGYGNLVIIKHGSGWLTAYAHLKESSVKKDQKVKKGQKIGIVGSTGKVPFPQLYFGLRKGNDAVNPENYLH